jgi:hypothetical protein
VSLFSPPDYAFCLLDSLTNYSVSSIVAVHGLGGDASTTWTHPKSNAFWLKDFLPRQIPDARIMTFDYNAALAFGQSTAEVIDHAKSLLSSLVDKREEMEVHNLTALSISGDDVDFESGDSTSSDIHCTLSRRNRGETSMSMPEAL